MNLFTITFLIVCLTICISCTGKLTPATEVVYEGELTGNDTVTYPSALRVVEICEHVRACIGRAGTDYPLPKIRGMRGGNAVECGGTLKRGCYTVDGFITVPEGGNTDIIAHECVHRWLSVDTGDLEPDHSWKYFLTCGGGLKLFKDLK